MKPLQVALLLAVAWAGSLGIAFGVVEWRQRDDPNAALIAQAEACQSAVAWREAAEGFNAPIALQAVKAMNSVCGELDPSSIPGDD